MKILYISHEYGGRRLKYADVLRGLGHEVDLVRIKQKQTPGQVDADAFSRAYDAVWCFSADYVRFGVLTPAFVDAVRQSEAVFTGAVIIAVGTPFTEWVESCRAFDVWFTGSRMVESMAREQDVTNVRCIPFGFDPADYFKLKRGHKWNLTFMGSSQTKVDESLDLRCQLLNSLKGFGIRVFGDAEMRKRLDRKIKVTPYSTHKEQNLVYNRSRINLDIPYINSVLPEYRGKYYPKNRLFEVPGSGNFLLEAYSDEFNAMLRDGEHCGYYEPEKIGEAIEHYLTAETEREEIARAGQAHVLDHYTNRHCFAAMCDAIQQIR